MQTLVYTTEPVPLHDLKPGDRIEHDCVVYRFFRLVAVVQPGGWMALAVPRGPGGGWDGESVGLYYANRKAVVLRVCGAEVLPWAAH